MEVELWRARNEYLSTLSARVEAQQLIPHSFWMHARVRMPKSSAAKTYGFSCQNWELVDTTRLGFS
jgi:hypothetical protein